MLEQPGGLIFAATLLFLASMSTIAFQPGNAAWSASAFSPSTVHGIRRRALDTERSTGGNTSAHPTTYCTNAENSLSTL